MTSYVGGWQRKDKYPHGGCRVAHQVLNAKPEQLRAESQIIAEAGIPGCVTIATNMAGASS